MTKRWRRFALTKWLLALAAVLIGLDRYISEVGEVCAFSDRHLYKLPTEDIMRAQIFNIYVSKFPQS